MKKIKALLYCCKVKPYLKRYWFNGDDGCGYNYETSFCINEGWEEEINLNGTIVAECEIEVEEIYLAFKGMTIEEYVTSHFRQKELLEHSCLTFDELDNYLQGKNGYALHISNLKVFDKPLTFEKNYIYKDIFENKILNKAPQNMCNVYDRFGNHYVLISIRPQWLCKELNREKDIEIRRQVLNYMKE